MTNILALKEKLESEIRELYVQFDNSTENNKWDIESKLLEKK